MGRAREHFGRDASGAFYGCLTGRVRVLYVRSSDGVMRAVGEVCDGCGEVVSLRVDDLRGLFGIEVDRAGRLLRHRDVSSDGVS